MWSLSEWQLWPALLALAIPLIIHLWRRKKPEVIFFPTFKFLEKTNSVRIHKIQLHQRILMLFRMLLIGVFALFLLQPVMSRKNPAEKVAKKWILAHSSVLTNSALNHEEIDNLIDRGFELHLLDTSYRERKSNVYPQSPVKRQPISSWDVLRLAGNLFAKKDSLVIIADPVYETVWGGRPKIEAHVDYRSIPVESDSPFLRDTLSYPSTDIHFAGKYFEGNWVLTDHLFMINNSNEGNRPIGIIDRTDTQKITNRRLQKRVLIVENETVNEYGKWLDFALELLEESYPLDLHWEHLDEKANTDIYSFDVIFWLTGKPEVPRGDHQRYIIPDYLSECEQVLKPQSGIEWWVFCPGSFDGRHKIPGNLPLHVAEILFRDQSIDKNMEEKIGLLADPKTLAPQTRQANGKSNAGGKSRNFDVWLTVILLFCLITEFIWSGNKLNRLINE